MNFPLESNDNESTYDLINSNADDKQSENSDGNVYSESGCFINYESEETLDFTKDCAKESEEDKESSLLTKKRNRTTVDNLTVDDLTEKVNQRQLK